MLASLRPLLLPSAVDDPVQRIGFFDGVGVTAPSGGAGVEVVDGRVYLGLSLRNVGTGIAVLHGARLYRERLPAGNLPAPLEEFHRLTRDLYIPPGEVGFWQGAFRDDDTDRELALEAIEAGEFGIEVLYSDYEGGQRVVTRFGAQRQEDGSWPLAAGRHWQIDRQNSR
jgi:hypothetical protein